MNDIVLRTVWAQKITLSVLVCIILYFLCLCTNCKSRMHSVENSLASPVVTCSPAGVALLVPLPSAHAVILYWAPGTAGLIVTLLPLPVFTYSPIIGTPKRITSYVAMILVALPCAVVSYTTCELVTLVTVTPGGGTVCGKGELWCTYVASVLLCGFCLCVTDDCVHAQWKVGMAFNFIWQVMSICAT